MAWSGTGARSLSILHMNTVVYYDTSQVHEGNELWNTPMFWSLVDLDIIHESECFCRYNVAMWAIPHIFVGRQTIFVMEFLLRRLNNGIIISGLGLWLSTMKNDFFFWTFKGLKQNHEIIHSISKMHLKMSSTKCRPFSHWGQDKIVAILQRNFKNYSLKIDVYGFEYHPR